MLREPDTEYVLSLSYGKDSLACLAAIHYLGYPLDRIVRAEVWATDTIPADLPPMVEFKKKADQIILDRYGIAVEHICASRAVERERERERERVTYENTFYRKLYSKKYGREQIYGFPTTKGAWCNSRLKMAALNAIKSSSSKKVVQYLGIAADEPERIARHTRPGIVLPLVDLGWDEATCRQWCELNDLLSPIYTTADRGGCWFCHNQGIEQLRLLRKNYPDLWALLLKWDADSPITFKPLGRTVAHFEKRFQMEDDGKLKAGDKKFRWSQVFPEERKEDINECGVCNGS